MLDWMNGKFGEVETVMQSGIVVAAIAAVAMMYWRTKALVATLGAMVLAGAVVWGTANVDWFSNKVGEETGMAPPASVVLHPPAQSG